MKTLIFSLTLLLSFTCHSQDTLVDKSNTEFIIHDNGLIYDDVTMKQLGQIVDSMNIRFRHCEPKNYVSLSQGNGHYVEFSRNARNVRQAIRNNMPFDEFCKKFPQVKVRDLWVLKYRYEDYDEQSIIKYSSLPLSNRDEIELHLDDRIQNDKLNGWVYEESEDQFSAIYLEKLTNYSFPLDYARLVQYVDCMVDTTAEIFYNDPADRDFEPLPTTSKVSQFIAMANDFEGEPEYPQIAYDSPFASQQYHKYQRERIQWNNKRIDALDARMKEAHNRALLTDAAFEALAENHSTEEFEFYVERYLSAADALELKRHRRVIGGCSMDQRPREHAANICRLAATTAQWDIFLRAHLDIMNDNFERMTDGSYAWASRGTYLRELEELDINAVDLLIGTCLRAENVNENHYFGDIGRNGRALAEAKDPDLVEQRLQSMIQNAELDLFNRLVIAYLYNNYIYHLKDEQRKISNKEHFKKAIRTLPPEIASSFANKR